MHNITVSIINRETFAPVLYLPLSLSWSADKTKTDRKIQNNFRITVSIRKISIIHVYIPFSEGFQNKAKLFASDYLKG